VALEPVHITVTTCPLTGISPVPYADFTDYFRLYNTCPVYNPSAVLLAESDPAFFCG